MKRIIDDWTTGIEVESWEVIAARQSRFEGIGLALTLFHSHTSRTLVLIIENEV